MFPRVYNKKTDGIPPGSVFVGRPSKWGNPWSHLGDTTAEYRVATREEAIVCFHEYIYDKIKDFSFKEELIRELRGRDLVCYCVPKLCHAAILLEIANAD